MKAVIDLLTFKSMVSPFLLQVLFWAGIGGVMYGTYVLIRLENWAWVFAISLGPLLVRVVFERAILAFRTYDRVNEIGRELDSLKTAVEECTSSVESQ